MQLWWGLNSCCFYKQSARSIHSCWWTCGLSSSGWCWSHLLHTGDCCISLATEVPFPFWHVIMYTFTYQMAKRTWSSCWSTADIFPFLLFEMDKTTQWLHWSGSLRITSISAPILALFTTWPAQWTKSQVSLMDRTALYSQKGLGAKGRQCFAGGKKSTLQLLAQNKITIPSVS